MVVDLNRRQALVLGSASFLSGLLMGGGASAETGDTLTIAFNVNLPAFDPTTGPSSVNPTIQAIYRSIFDQYIGQNTDLSLTPGLLTKWGWNDDKTKAWMDVREGVVWHDGSPFTPEDVVWSIERAGDPKGGNPVAFVWGSLGNFKIDGHHITADCKNFDPTIFKWMAFLTGYVLPKGYYKKVGAEGFEKKPIGTGPYMVDEYQGNAFLRLKRNDKVLGPEAHVRDRDLQVRAGWHEPRRRDRKRLVRRDARDPLRGIRPPEGQAGSRRRVQADHRHRHDLHHQCRKGDA